MEATPGGWTETLANLSIGWIFAIVAALTFVRLNLVRVESPAARSFAEILESSLIAVVLVFLVIRPFVVQAYFIPSPSMEPTLLGKNGSGDRILVNKFQYRFQSEARGDVVVFIPPASATEGSPEEPSGVPVNFIKRLIARDGDRLQAVSGKVIIDGKVFNHYDIRRALATHGDFGPDANIDGDLQADHHVKFTDAGVMADGKLVQNTDLATMLVGMPNAHVEVKPGYNILNGQRLSEPFIAEDPDYDLKIYQGKPLKADASGEYKLNGLPLTKFEYDRDNANPTEPLPKDTLFMMGDNRNDSKDSTEWGPLPKERVVGHAQAIFWPLNRVRAIR